MQRSSTMPPFPWGTLFIPVVPWLPGAGAAIFLKYKLIWPVLKATGDYPASSNFEAFMADGRVSWLDYLSYFRADLLLCVIAVPAFLMLLGRVLPPALGAWSAALLGTAAILVVYIQRQALNNVGVFLAWAPLLDAAAWVALHPSEVLTYLKPMGLLRAAGLIAASVGTAYLIGHRQNTTESTLPVPGLLRRSFAGAALFAVALTACAWLPQQRSTWLHRAALVRAVDPLVASDPPPMTTAVELDPLVLEARYRELSNAPSATSHSEYFGAAAGYNLLIVVLETAPARIVDLTAAIEEYPTLARLRPRSFLAFAHHTTYPTSEAAFFSLMTSFYGGDLIRIFGPPIEWAPSFLHGLRDRGYSTFLGMPNGALYKEEERMWAAVGIETLRSPAPPPGARVVWAAPWQERVRIDRAAREQLLDDIRNSVRTSRNFAAIYFPQSSHAPWLDTISDGEHASIPERGKAVFAAIDSWIGEIVEELERLGELEHTLVLVTGDHGVRTREEDPELPLGKIDAYTFQVPFLLFAPGILEQTVEIPWLTSHIDVSPTLEALYGIKTAPAMAQGAPIWEPELAKRTTFFWSGKFHGAMGFHKAGNFAMWNRFYDEAFESSSLNFVGIPAAQTGSTRYIEAVKQIQEMEAVNRQWVSAVLRIAD